MVSIRIKSRSQVGRQPCFVFAGSRGYTLIEILLVLVILAILATMLVPAYREYTVKANRAAGRGVLLDVMARQEQYYLNNKSYATTLAGLGLPAAYYVDRLAGNASAQQSVYKIELIVRSSVYQGVRAVPQNAQRRDTSCMVLAIDLRGLKSVSGTDSASPFACW